MKWPESDTLVRHDESAYNRIKVIREKDPLYRKFMSAYDKDFESPEAKRLAELVAEKFTLDVADHDTPLAEGAGWKAEEMARNLKNIIKVPDVVLVSPYLRTLQTLERMQAGWPELKNVKTVEDIRLREQNHGDAAFFSDWRVYNVMNPVQKKRRDLYGTYWYKYHGGEDGPDVEDRQGSMLDMLIREYAEANVVEVSHHLTILLRRKKVERLSVAEFIRLDKKEKPLNAGVTIYDGKPGLGSRGEGKLVLRDYNLKLYPDERPLLVV